MDELGSALESWLAKKRQCEDYTDRDGNSCRVSEDSLMAALYKLMLESLEEAVMFRSEDYPSFNDLFDKLTSYASTKHSLFLSNRDLQSGSSSSNKKDPDAMDVGAISKGKKGDAWKGKSKGKAIICHGCGRPGHRIADCKFIGSGKGKGGGGQDRTSNVKCWVCNGHGHYGKDCPSKGKSKGGGKEAYGKKGDGKPHKGKGGKSANAVEEPNASAEGRDDLGYLDLNLCLSSVEATPHYVVRYDGGEWLRINYDSGAATTVIPSEVVVHEVALEEAGEFVVASGENIPRFGRVRLPMTDEKGNARSVSTIVVGVHKPLGSAAECSKSHDYLLMVEGGYLIPRNSDVARGVRAECERLMRLYGEADILPIYREGNLYKYYLKRWGAAVELSSVGGDGSSKSGESRQAQEL